MPLDNRYRISDIEDTQRILSFGCFFALRIIQPQTEVK